MEVRNYRKSVDCFNKIKDVSTVLISGPSRAKENSKISIFIPTYSRVDTLKIAIESAINQETEIPYNIIVVDDNCTGENTGIPELLSQYSDSVSYYQNKSNIKLGNNLNRCAELCETEYISFLHDDDVLKDNYITEVSKVINRKNIDVLINSFDIMNYPFSGLPNNSIKNRFKNFFYSNRRQLKRIKTPVPSLFLDNFFGPPSCGVLIKKSVFMESGGYNEEEWPSLDWTHFIFLSLNYKLYIYRKSLSYYVWGNNISMEDATLIAFSEQRKIIIESLCKYFWRCNILHFLFKKDFRIKEKSRLEQQVKYSKIYSLFVFLYSVLYSR